MFTVRATLGRIRRSLIRSLGGEVPGQVASQGVVPSDYASLQQAIGAVLAPQVPTPLGLSIPEVEAMMRSISLDGSPRGALDAYVDDSLWRFLYSWNSLQGRTGSMLELGANPYFTTMLLESYCEAELTLANYFGPTGALSGVQALSYTRPNGETWESAMVFDHFDVEHDRFPYDDGSFDTVVFCEIIEHLLEDPVATLNEINRVLDDDGVLFLTTPNVARLENILKLIAGENLYDPYSGFGPYGRHNREYTMHDLATVLSFCGFSIEGAFTADSHPWMPSRPELVPVVAPYLQGRQHELGHYLFVTARKTSPPRVGRPSWLYRSLPEGEIVEWNSPG